MTVARVVRTVRPSSVISDSRAVTIHPPRGEIYDRHGVLLATNAVEYEIGLSPVLTLIWRRLGYTVLLMGLSTVLAILLAPFIAVLFLGCVLM